MPATRQPVVRPLLLIVVSTFVLVLAPAVVLWLIARYGVNTIVWDQIEIGRFLVRNHGRTFPALGDLFAQHNESRKFFPRLLFFYLARATNWNVKYEMAISFILACGVAANLSVLARRALADRVLTLAATAVCAMLVFSPVQWWNWLFGIQIVVFVPILMLTSALVVFQSRWRSSLRVAVMAVLCIIATFSYANGMLLWLVLLLPLSTLREKRLVLITLWTIVAAVSIAAYFYDYHKPRGHPPLASPIAAPILFVNYILVFLGRPLVWASRVPVAAITGAVALIAFLLLVIWARRWRMIEAVSPAAIGLYAIASACATAVGRLGLSLRQALEQRYTTFSIYLFIAIAILGFLVARRARSPRLAAYGATALIVMGVGHVLAVRAAWPEMVQNYRERLLGRTAVQFALVSPDRAALKVFVWPYTPQAVAVVDALSQIGYINPPPLRSDLINGLIADPLPRYGAVDHVSRISKDAVGISGWASLPGPRSADAVLLTRTAPDGEHVVAISIGTALKRPDIANIDTALLHSGWFVQAPVTLLRSRATLNAWAWDSGRERAFRLAGGIKAE